MSQATDIARRTPSQMRSAATVDTLFEATARILESGEDARLTTNRIAERAGFSIGTLYGYFPDKRALLRAMALREARRQEANVVRELDDAGPDRSAEDMVRLVVRAALRPFAGRNRLRMAMMKLVLADAEIVAAASSAHEQVWNLLLQEIIARSNGTVAVPGPHTCFLLHAAVSGAIVAAATQRMDIFETQAFEDDLVRLMLSSLTCR